VLTGNPIRQDLLADVPKSEAYSFFNLDPAKKTVLIIGGSLGALTLNRSIIRNLALLEGSDVQVLWQCGKRYFGELTAQLREQKGAQNLFMYDFIRRMDLAYKAADLVISRAGASSISEVSVLGKPSILIPSPNVAEDHQTKNAMALVNKGAAVMMKDGSAPSELLPLALNLIKDEVRMQTLSGNIKKLGFPNAASLIVDEIDKLVSKN
jgi:UDP-N-acetylglucosamine--N-acetylmuramyl-(pentapeptide) pyrophosphoryl-undecaprenol N-acetylglucosamine transferase